MKDIILPDRRIYYKQKQILSQIKNNIELTPFCNSIPTMLGKSKKFWNEMLILDDYPNVSYSEWILLLKLQREVFEMVENNNIMCAIWEKELNKYNLNNRAYEIYLDVEKYFKIINLKKYMEDDTN